MRVDTKSKDDLSIKEQVEAALPDGPFYKLPDDLHQKLKDATRKESPSSITTFLMCPLRWYLERYAGIPGDSEVGFAMVLGTFVHRILEVLYSEPKHKRTEKLLQEIFDHAWDCLRNHNTEDGILDESLVKEFTTLEDSARNASGFRNKFKESSLDAAFSIVDFDIELSEIEILGNETWIRRSVKGIFINGKIDRRIRGVGGKEIIDDYKTGRPPEGEIDVLNPTFVSIGLYAWMRSAQKVGGLNVEVEKVRLLYLGALKRYSITITPEVLEKTDRLVNGVIDMMNDIVETGEIMITPAEKSDKPPCSWCPARNICPAFQEDGSFEPMREDLGI